MDGRGIAWLSYVPVPGLALVPVLLHPADPLARYHAWQGTAHTLAFLASLLVLGFLTLLSKADGYRLVVGLVAGVVLVGGFVQLVWGAAGAAMGRYHRIRPAWDLAAAVRKDG